jgi:hypothetical protein
MFEIKQAVASYSYTYFKFVTVGISSNHALARMSIARIALLTVQGIARQRQSSNPEARTQTPAAVSMPSCLLVRSKMTQPESAWALRSGGL